MTAKQGRMSGRSIPRNATHAPPSNSLTTVINVFTDPEIAVQSSNSPDDDVTAYLAKNSIDRDMSP